MYFSRRLLSLFLSPPSLSCSTSERVHNESVKICLSIKYTNTLTAPPQISQLVELSRSSINVYRLTGLIAVAHLFSVILFCFCIQTVFFLVCFILFKTIGITCSNILLVHLSRFDYRMPLCAQFN